MNPRDNVANWNRKMKIIANSVISSLEDDLSMSIHPYYCCCCWEIKPKHKLKIVTTEQGCSYTTCIDCITSSGGYK